MFFHQHGLKDISRFLLPRHEHLKIVKKIFLYANRRHDFGKHFFKILSLYYQSHAENLKGLMCLIENMMNQSSFNVGTYHDLQKKIVQLPAQNIVNYFLKHRKVHQAFEMLDGIISSKPLASPQNLVLQHLWLCFKLSLSEKRSKQKEKHYSRFFNFTKMLMLALEDSSLQNFNDHLYDSSTTLNHSSRFTKLLISADDIYEDNAPTRMGAIISLFNISGPCSNNVSLFLRQLTEVSRLAQRIGLNALNSSYLIPYLQAQLGIGKFNKVIYKSILFFYGSILLSELRRHKISHSKAKDPRKKYLEFILQLKVLNLCDEWYRLNFINPVRVSSMADKDELFD